METNCQKIWITNDSLVADIQGQFTLLYPFLKIEFLSNSKTDKLTPKIKIKQLTSYASAKIDLCNSRTIAEVEEDFKTNLGLQIKVFRKSGNVWNSISITDSWTLDSQNKAGEFISIEMGSGN